ncbi:MAG: ANTAR domain-containing protein [Vallitaleaceae bacterium]|jgi:AmiR/NasT family two-component response regulator|nr:ANTAR domain-containing protein [Vallitaleaceae bacterium]
MSIRILVGSSSEKVTKQLTKFLIENGLSVVGETLDGYELLRRAHTVYPDIVLVDYNMKGLSGHQIAEILVSEKLCPVVALISSAEVSYFVNLNLEPTFVPLVKPINKQSLMNTINLLVKTSKSISQLESRVTELTSSQDTTKVINSAKKLLMENMELTESEAHRRIQKQSMDKGIAKIKVAQMIIALYE